MCAALNQTIGADMVRHGVEARFARRGDEPITVAFRDGTHPVPYDGPAVRRWYEERDRAVLAGTGHDDLRDRPLALHCGPQGMFASGQTPPGGGIWTDGPRR